MMKWTGILAGMMVLCLVARSQVITTVAGTGMRAYGGDGGPAAKADLHMPVTVATDTAGNLYIVDGGNNTISRVGADGLLHILVGKQEGHVYNPAFGYNGDGGPATNAVLWKPRGLVPAADGSFYFGDYDNSVVRIVEVNGTINTLTGFPVAAGQKTALPRLIKTRDSLRAATGGYLFFADEHNHTVRQISADGKSHIVVGTGVRGYRGDGGPATLAALNSPWGVVADAMGNLYVADAGNNVVRRVTPGGIISTYAGNGTAGYSGDGGAATAAAMEGLRGMAIDAGGNLYVTDAVHHVVRVIGPDGRMTTLAGNGIRGYRGDGGQATAASLNQPTGVAVDRQGNLYIADAMNHVVRKVTPAPPAQEGRRPDTHTTDAAVSSSHPVKPIVKKVRRKVNGYKFSTIAKERQQAEALAAESRRMAAEALAAEEAAAEKERQRLRRRLNATGFDFASLERQHAEMQARLERTRREEQEARIAAEKMAAEKREADRVAENARRRQAAAGSFDFSALERLQQERAAQVEAQALRERMAIQKADADAARVAREAALARRSLLNGGFDFSRVLRERQEQAAREAARLREEQRAEEIKQAAPPVVQKPDYRLLADAERNELVVQTDSGAYATYSITDMTGKELLAGKITKPSMAIDISGLPGGRYYINLKKGDKVRSGMFVKDR
jgi:hypothetical protein